MGDPLSRSDTQAAMLLHLYRINRTFWLSFRAEGSLWIQLRYRQETDVLDRRANAVWDLRRLAGKGSFWSTFEPKWAWQKADFGLSIFRYTAFQTPRAALGTVGMVNVSLWFRDQMDMAKDRLWQMGLKVGLEVWWVWLNVAFRPRTRCSD